MSKANELEAIRDQMRELLSDAQDVVSDTHHYSQAKAYWIPQIEMILSKDHSYLGGSMCDMEDTINALRKEENESENKFDIEDKVDFEDEVCEVVDVEMVETERSIEFLYTIRMPDGSQDLVRECELSPAPVKRFIGLKA